MRIAFLNDDSLPTARGGAAVVVDRLRRELSRRGHEVILITTHQEDNRLAIQKNKDDAGTVFSIKTIVPAAERHWRCIKNLDVLPHIKKILSDFRPDVVHAHNLHAYLSYACLEAAKEFTNRLFLTAHDTFLVSFHRVSGERFFQSSLRGVPYRMSIFDHMRDAGRRFNPLRNSRIRAILRRTGTIVISISDALDAFLHANGITNTHVIHNGVPPTPPPPSGIVETFRARHHLAGPTILFAGRVSEDKGIGALLDAVGALYSSIPDVHVLIAGESGSVEPFLRSRSKEVRQLIRMTGWLPQEEMPLVYAACDIVTTPSLYLDAFNLTNIEAMAAGRPVVGTCFGGTPEIIEDSVTGYIVDPRDTKIYAEKLTELLTNADIRMRMGLQGRKRAEEFFSLHRQGKEYLRMYTKERQGIL